jgi:hypothetical protein
LSTPIVGLRAFSQATVAVFFEVSKLRQAMLELVAFRLVVLRSGSGDDMTGGLRLFRFGSLAAAKT